MIVRAIIVAIIMLLAFGLIATQLERDRLQERLKDAYEHLLQVQARNVELERQALSKLTLGI